MIPEPPAKRGDSRPLRRPPKDLGLAGLVVALLLSALAATVPGSYAAFTATVTSSTNNTRTADYFTCGGAILADGPRIYYKLDEASGTTAVDSSGGSRNGTYRGTVVRGAATACGRDSGSAVTLNGSSGYVSSSAQITTSATTGFSGEAWFKTTSGSGGLVLGVGAALSGVSGSVDRVVYMTNSGRLVFGLNNVSKDTIASSASYNDGSWHHVMATAGSAGMRLYVDGNEVASGTTTMTGSYTGYLRLGYDSLLLWPNTPTTSFFAGSIDEAAVYLKTLSAASAASHAAAGR